MAVALDTYDKESGIHPRNKQLTSQRLAIAGLNVAYKQESYPSNGPFPETVDITPLEDGYQVDILYDQAFHWNATESEGFYICTMASIAECNSHHWEKVKKTYLCLVNTCLLSNHLCVVATGGKCGCFRQGSVNANTFLCNWASLLVGDNTCTRN